MHRLPVFALFLFLSTGWWGDIVRATASALGFEALVAAEEPAPPPPPPSTDSACSMDPWGCPRP